MIHNELFLKLVYKLQLAGRMFVGTSYTDFIISIQQWLETCLPPGLVQNAGFL